jgi:hypothetical protein
MKKLGRLLKNLNRRMRILEWRNKKRRKKRGPTPLYEKVFHAGIFVGLIASVYFEKYFLAEAIFWSGMAAGVVFAGIHWRRGRYQGKRSFQLALGNLAFIMVSMLAFSAGAYAKFFTTLPQQVETDAYLKENSTEIGRNVDHFVSLHASGDLRTPKMEDLTQWPTMPPILSSAMLRLPLLAKSWMGEIPQEDVTRHTMWNLQDLSESWMVFPRSMTQEEIDAEATHVARPAGATHPYIFATICHETRDGRILAEPFFGALPSNDVDRADFKPIDEHLKHKADHLGVINVPYPLHGFDAAPLDFMAPLADVCRVRKPSAATAE